jgi:hypothetical protein
MWILIFNRVEILAVGERLNCQANWIHVCVYCHQQMFFKVELMMVIQSCGLQNINQETRQFFQYIKNVHMDQYVWRGGFSNSVCETGKHISIETKSSQQNLRSAVYQ